jgi:hypothetical protein
MHLHQERALSWTDRYTSPTALIQGDPAREAVPASLHEAIGGAAPGRGHGCRSRNSPAVPPTSSMAAAAAATSTRTCRRRRGARGRVAGSRVESWGHAHRRIVPIFAGCSMCDQIARNGSAAVARTISTLSSTRGRQFVKIRLCGSECRDKRAYAHSEGLLTDGGAVASGERLACVARRSDC